MSFFLSLTARRSAVVAIFALWLFGGGAAISVLAQDSTTGAFIGQVRGPDDKPRGNIKVTAINTRNKAKWTRTTDSDGNYRFEYLPPGNYNIEARGLPKYPNVIIENIEAAHPNTKRIPIPHITLGRVLLIIRILGQGNQPVPAVVTAAGGSERFEEHTQINGECRFLYLRDGNYKIDIYIGGRLRGTTYFSVNFRSNQQYQLPPYVYPQGQPLGQIFEIREDLLAAVDRAINVAVPQETTVVRDDADARASADADEAEPVWRASESDRRITSFPSEIRQTVTGSPLTIGRAIVLQQNPPPASADTTAPQIAASTLTTATGSATVLLVNTTSAARSSDFTERQIEALPLGGGAEMRTYDELVFLAPGIAPPPHSYAPHGPGVGFGVNTAGEFSANGARTRTNNFTVDGSDNNDPDVGGRRQGFVALVPQSLESIKGFSISTLLWNAELGRNLGSQVNAVSKYGEDDWHGQAYAFFTSSKLNARNFFDNTDGDFCLPKPLTPCGKDPLTRLQTGLALGGPIIRGRTHLFGSVEGIKTSAMTEQHFSSPLASERRFLPDNLTAPPDQTPLKRGNGFFGVFPFSGDDKDRELLRTDSNGTPVGNLILVFYPLPNSGGPYGQNTLTKLLPADGSAAIFSLKATHQFAPNSLLSGRYNFTDDRRILPSINRAIRSTTKAAARTQNLSLIFNGALGAKHFLQTRFSYGRTRLGFTEQPGSELTFSGTGTTDIGNLGKNVPVTTGPIGGLIIEPYSPVGVDVFTIPQNRVNNTFQFGESVSYRAGSHAFRFGSEILHYHFDSLLDRNYRPLATYGYAIQAAGNFRVGPPDIFQQRWTQVIPGVQLAALGVASSILQTLTVGQADSKIRLRYTQYSFFAADNWRIHPHLTLDVGLRYEYGTVPREADDLIENALRLENIPMPDSSSSFFSVERIAKFEAAVSQYGKVLGNRTSIYDPDRNNFGPHAGFAWDPRGDGRTAVRAGYGIYYGVILGALVSQSRSVFPAEIPVNIDPLFVGFNVLTLNNPALLGGLTGDLRALPNPPLPLIQPGTLNQLAGGRKDFAALVGELFMRNGSGGGLAFTLPNKELPTPYTQQWHLTIERELLDGYLLSAAYVGTKGAKLTRLTTPNLGPLVTAYIPVGRPMPFGTNPHNFPIVLTSTNDSTSGPRTQLSRPLNRSYENLGAYQIFENSAASNYHSLQIEARKRFERNYTFTAAYTWSHAIDDVSDIFPVAGAPNLPQSTNLRGERASANFDIRHRFAASVVWDLPFYRNRAGWKARLLGGWQVASIFQAHTGQPFTLHVPFDVNGDGNLTDRPSTMQGLIFCACEDGRRRRIALAPGVGVSDFVPRTPDGLLVVQGQDGAVDRNSVRGAGFITLDLALNRKFRFNEHRHLEFRAEFFNLANRANFGLPIRTIGSPGFGSAVETVSPARIIQFALKYNFSGRPNQ
ncbi:MAG: TonB-dependent receptor [Acidobacteriota bacterium]